MNHDPAYTAMPAVVDIDSVLVSAPPRFGPADAVRIAHQTFGLRSVAARDLGSERDQSFLLLDADAHPAAVLKVSNVAENPATLDMEARAVLHAARVDPALPLAIPWRVPARSGPDDPAGRRAAIDGPDGQHQVRLYDVLPGRQRIDPLTLSDAALAGWGATTARLGWALRGFFDPRAQRTMLWDVQHATRTRAFVDTIRDTHQRVLVTRVLDRFEAKVEPAWPSLRAQVVHGDLTTDNALADSAGRITGVVDFGDMSHSALVVDLVSTLDSLVTGRDDPFRVARLVIDGYQRVTPLEPVEIGLIGELLAARAAVTIAISSWRSSHGLEDAAFAERFNASASRTIEAILDVGWEDLAHQFGADATPGPDRTLRDRRTRVMGPALEPLTYECPIHVAEASGTWMTGTDGRRYLDAYNNVPSVGHAHPRVTEAIARQARRVNTNMRYLHGTAVELAERLIATCPPGLDTVMFVNSGSEANDLAWRLATTFTGHRGGLCTSFAYHGISDAIAPLTPETWPGHTRPEHVETWPAPDRYRGRDEQPDGFSAAIDRLAARGIEPAVTILDGVLTSDGFAEVESSYIAEVMRRTHAAGALWIADEVQGGHGRSGSAMWSFQRFGIVPDFVTLGKPMGNGHPVGAVITRREIAERFAAETVFFSTFGGNPVSAAAALAVLDVLEDERVLDRVSDAGEQLRGAIREVAGRHPALGDTRGVGLAIGIEVVADPAAKIPDPARAGAIKEGLRERGVLVGTCGAAGNVIKVRPPLAFTAAEVPIFAAALEATMVALRRA